MPRFTVFEGSVGLHFFEGKLQGVVSPGVYRFRWYRDHHVVTVCTQTTSSREATMEVMTRDGAMIRVAVGRNSRITDARRAFESGALGSVHHHSRVNVMTEQMAVSFLFTVALREWIMSRTLEEVLEGRNGLANDLFQQLKPALADKGIELESVFLVDFSLSGPLRQSMANLLKAEVDGQVSLARARNEAATLRSLANSARMLREHPRLLELRMLATGIKPKITFVVNDSVEPPNANEAEDA